MTQLRRHPGLGIPDRYLLFVGRFVPEKAPDLLLRAFRQVAGDDRLVLAGNSSFTSDYVQGLRERAAEDPRVVLAGFVYGAELEELYGNAAAFVLPSGIGAREAVIVGALTAVLPYGQALALAVVSRVVFTVVELVCAGVATLAAQLSSRREART